MVWAAVSRGGAAIWAMHFGAMLAYDIPSMGAIYNVGMTVESLRLAIAGTGIGVVIISGGEDWGRLLAGGYGYWLERSRNLLASVRRPWMCRRPRGTTWSLWRCRW